MRTIRRHGLWQAFNFAAFSIEYIEGPIAAGQAINPFRYHFNLPIPNHARRRRNVIASAQISDGCSVNQLVEKKSPEFTCMVGPPNVVKTNRIIRIFIQEIRLSLQFSRIDPKIITFKKCNILTLTGQVSLKIVSDGSNIRAPLDQSYFPRVTGLKLFANSNLSLNYCNFL